MQAFLENRGRTLESIHNVKKLSLRFAEVLRLFTRGMLSLGGKGHDGGICGSNAGANINRCRVNMSFAKRQQESSSKDDGLHRERTETNCCSRDRCGIGYRRWHQVFHYLCWRGVKYSWSRRDVLHDRCRCSVYCWCWRENFLLVAVVMRLAFTPFCIKR